MVQKIQFLPLIFFLCFAPILSGCGLIFGGDQRVDIKSHDYTVVRLDRDPSLEWRTLSSTIPDPKENTISQETGDIAFEHKNTGAIISLNSVCREYRDASLEELTRYLLLGLNTQGPVNSRPIKVDGTKALESTVNASMVARNSSSRTPSDEGVPVKVRAVVMSKSGCTFDIMLISQPKYFQDVTPSFDRFLKGFHVP